MYIAKVLSNLGAWDAVQEAHSDIYTELMNVVDSIQPQRTKRTKEKNIRGNSLISPRDLFRQFTNQLGQYGWSQNRIEFGDDIKSGFTEIDYVKGKIGVEISFGKFTFAESHIFVKFPIFIQAKVINIPILIMPMRLLAQEMGLGVGSFEMVERRLREISPFLPRYPFAIIGISHEQSRASVTEYEFSSPLDQFLSKIIGFTLLDLKLNLERPNCDFKEDLPTQPERIAKQLCALANLDGGGMLLVGIDDNGNIQGIMRENLDERQSRISRIAHSSVEPIPEIQYQVFDVVGKPEKCILAVQISEVKRKPCVANERVYIRSGSQTLAATSDEIRKLLLGSGA